MMDKHPIHLETRDPSRGSRLISPSAGRNSNYIAEVLKTYLPKEACVLEIASGTGQHAVAVCKARSDVHWQTSDPDERSRQSQNAWRSECPTQIALSRHIDVTLGHWWDGLASVDAMFCANMIHIAPWEAALGYVKGASHLIKPQGMAILYGPFLENEYSAASNLKFDHTLKAKNPLWGVRELDSVKYIFAEVGFNLLTRVEMPAENLILIFSRP